MTGLVMELLLEVLIGLAAAMILRRYVLCFSLIRGRSMLPTLHDREVILVWRGAYLRSKPRRGDVVICYYPGRKMKKIPWMRQPMVKRVIGLPGEHLEIIEGQTFIDGHELREDYLDERYTRFHRMQKEVQLGENQYFVMGDNRDNSNDSRRVGPLEKNAMTGRAICVLWPPRAWRKIR